MCHLRWGAAQVHHHTADQALGAVLWQVQSCRIWQLEDRQLKVCQVRTCRGLGLGCFACGCDRVINLREGLPCRPIIHFCCNTSLRLVPFILSSEKG